MQPILFHIWTSALSIFPREYLNSLTADSSSGLLFSNITDFESTDLEREAILYNC